MLVLLLPQSFLQPPLALPEPPKISLFCPEELAALDLLDFLMKDDAPCPEIPGKENGLWKDWGLPEPELLNKEMDDFISSLLSPFEDESGMLQGYSPADSDSSISEDQNLFHSPGSDFASNFCQ
ncbi:cyclic amp-responsive element-binding protein 3 [Limosa lapponica baueri]|uniref:Cyclic amp-responsive element-binding protein 3 n=1 Tax=Limosa lapponica baueri TaxID=1758121 RepID=A0A2I0TTL0_LIMLA|nr:cyclic amp-responsive element-binding protein 3 [Limosa lapponica baueri]